MLNVGCGSALLGLTIVLEFVITPCASKRAEHVYKITEMILTQVNYNNRSVTAHYPPG